MVALICILADEPAEAGVHTKMLVSIDAIVDTTASQTLIIKPLPGHRFHNISGHYMASHLEGNKFNIYPFDSLAREDIGSDQSIGHQKQMTDSGVCT